MDRIILALVLAAGPVLAEGSPTNAPNRINLSNRPVHLDRVRGTCSCATIEIQVGTIPPQGSRECAILIKATPESTQSARVYFHYSEPRGRVDSVGISFRGVSRGTLSTRTESVHLSEQVPGLPIEREIVVQHTEGGSFDQSRYAWTLEPAGKLRSLSSDIRIEGDARAYVLKFGVGPLAAGEKISGSAELTIGDPEVARIVIPISITTMRSLRIEPAVLDGRILNGSSMDVGTVRLSLPRGWTLDRVDAPEWLTTARPRMSGSEIEIPVSFTGETKRRLWSGALLLHIDRGESAKLECPAYVTVEDCR